MPGIRGLARIPASLKVLASLAIAAGVVICALTAGSSDAHGRVVGAERVGQTGIPVSLGPVAASLNPQSADTTSQGGPGQAGLTALDLDIAHARDGTTIHLASGRYSAIHDFSPRAGWVTVSGRGDRSPPLIDGAELWGAQHLRLDDVRFSATVGIDHSTVHQYRQPASHVVVENSTVDCGGPLTLGVEIRGGSRDITLAGDTIRDCGVGLGSIAQDRFSRNIAISHCTFEHFTGQALTLGGLSGVRISDSVIADISDPRHINHNDGILFYGNDRNVTITDNVLANSRNQLILITDPYRGRDDHTSINTHVLIADNVIYGAGAVAVQDQGGDDVAFVQNTMWHNHFGSLWVLRSGVSGRRPARTLIVGNLIQGLLFYGATPSLEAYNLIDGAAAHSPPGHEDLENLSPRFASQADGDFRLASDSPARRALAGASVRRYLSAARIAGPVIPLLRGSMGAQQPGQPKMSIGPPLPASNFVM